MSNKTGIYVHIPFCKRKCNYCAFVSVCDFSLMRDYVAKLKTEIAERATGEEVSTIYIGGGTPSTLYAGAISEIFGAIKAGFSVTPNAEITVEANPESLSEEFARECKECGVNRFSIGLQSSSAQFLDKAGRLHTKEMFENAVSVVRKTGICNISADLIYGFESQTVDDVVIDVEYLSSLDVNHISVYALTLEEGTQFAISGVKTDVDYQADLYLALCKKLKEKGYDRYEISNFAKKGYESKHNGKYWRHVPYLGFGVSAHSFYNSRRRANVSSIDDYLKGVYVSDEYEVGKEDLAQEHIMLGLRVREGIDLSAFEREFGVDLLAEKREEITMLKNLGLIAIDENRLKVSEKGVFLTDAIVLKLV